MPPKDETKAAFQVGDMARLTRFVPPILSGSIVRIEQVRRNGRCLVRPTEYSVHSVWVDGTDLAWVIA